MFGVRIYVGLFRRKSWLGYSYIAETIGGELILSHDGKVRASNGEIVMSAILKTLENKAYDITHIGIYTDDPYALYVTQWMKNELDELRRNGNIKRKKPNKIYASKVSNVVDKLYALNINLIVQDEPTSELYSKVIKNAEHASETRSKSTLF